MSVSNARIHASDVNLRARKDTRLDAAFRRLLLCCALLVLAALLGAHVWNTQKKPSAVAQSNGATAISNWKTRRR